MKGKRAKPIVHLVQHGGNIQDGLARAQRAVTLNIASHAVCDMRQGVAGSGVVCIFVDDAASVDDAIGPKGRRRSYQWMWPDK